jgi:hypothetical protein
MKPHNHADDRIVKKGLFIEAMKDAIDDDPTKPIRRVYKDILVRQ